MMKTRCIISLLVVAALIILAHPAIADDLADLKAAHQRFLKAWNTGDLETVFEMWPDGSIWLPASQAFPIVTNSARGKVMFAKWFETHIYMASWHKADYKVIGDTGLVWGLRTATEIVKATGTGKRNFYKTTIVFVKSEGNWKPVMFHDTPLISEADIF
jgi:ketosteroid isomerase-like protein